MRYIQPGAHKQRAALKYLHEHKEWDEHCGWTVPVKATALRNREPYRNIRATNRIMSVLEQTGLVERTARVGTFYRWKITQRGIDAAGEIFG